MFDPVGCVEKLADPRRKVVVKFLVGGQLGEDGDRVGNGKVGVLWCLLGGGGVGVTVILEFPPSVEHFGKCDLATVEGL